MLLTERLVNVMEVLFRGQDQVVFEFYKTGIITSAEGRSGFLLSLHFSKQLGRAELMALRTPLSDSRHFKIELILARIPSLSAPSIIEVTKYFPRISQ